MAGTLKQDDTEIELRSPDRRRKMAVVDPNGLTSMEIQEYKDVFEVLLWGDLERGVMLVDSAQLTLITWICQLCEKYERTQQGNLLG